MHFQCTLIAVTDMERAKQLYCGLLGMEVTADFGANVTLSNVLALHTVETWSDFLQLPQRDIIRGHHAGELYFETDDLDAFLGQLARGWPDTRFVHPVKVHAWGQRAVRIYDPDHNVVEVGENMSIVVRRILGEGMTVEEAARRMDVPVEYVRAMA